MNVNSKLSMAPPNPINPFVGIMMNVRSTSDRLVHSKDTAARAEYSRRLAVGAAQFRALALEMAYRANTLSPISKLPNEIFLITATFVAFLDPPRPSRRSRVQNPNSHPTEVVVDGSLGWISLMHVCRTWRRALLDAHCLWARNITVLPRAVRLLTHYAGPSIPLELEADLGRDLYVPSCEDLYALIPHARMRSMTWYLDKVPDTTVLHYKLSDPKLPLSNLERLTVVCSVFPDASQLPSIGPNHLPNLHTLTGSRFYGAFNMPNLTTWILSNLPIPLNIIFGDMNLCPLLAQVRLSGCRFRSEPITCRLQLPRLELLHIIDCETTAGESVYDIFQNHADIPTSTRFRLNPTGFLEDQEDLGPPSTNNEYHFLSAIQLCTRSFAKANHVPNILSVEEGSIFLMSYDGPPDKEDPVWQEGCLLGSLRLAEVVYGCDDVFETIFMDVATPASLGFDYITTLNVTFRPNVPWEYLYQALPNVKTLRISAQNKAAIEFLAVDLDDPDADLVLPRLSLLWIDDAAARIGTTQGGCGDTIREPLLRLVKMCAEFCARTARPADLEIVYLQNFKYIRENGDAFLNELRAIVPVVECFDTVYDTELCDKWDWSLRAF